MESLLYIVVRGIAIGILISAPMGPIGMLCIQRTLNKGRWPAFFTGMGAALSDLIYCLLTGLGLSFITDFIEANQLILQIIGSIVLAAFAFYLFRKNPARKLTTPQDAPNTYWKDFVTGFLLTFSNPLILFFIIGLFARFNFLLPEFRYYHYISGYIAIFGGAMLWWFTITFFVNKVRSHFNVRSLWLINRIIGSILLVMSAVGFVMGIKDYISL
ncbi:LysE family translocator [uncultured Duncaniella sp.]|uniref:LysE family translocator n=1 Tax=uncultured Duncaniella sp. TaxID=2768039 RepID=UPI00272AE367|nr:LysE family transporter [uncultured Duncaniella sp.]